LFLFYMPAARSRSTRVILTVILGASMAADALWESPPYVADWLTGNVFSANLATTERVRYSPAFEENFASRTAQQTQQQVAARGPQSGRNVVVVILESWSSWHSRLFGGSEDWTPHLDDAAQLGLRFTDFHSIGFTTSNGLVGILAGQKIWSPFLHLLERSPFHSMWGLDRTLPRTFSRSGYETAFLTTGPLSLYRKGEWMSDIGFRHVEGNEHPSYAGEKRYAFKSPSDAALYRRSLQWMKTAPNPYFLVLETVTTHQPFVDPDSGERSLEKAMRYADREFNVFLESLKDSGFFEQGLLVVVSDHRSMTPVSADELKRFGAGTFSRVPAFMIGREIAPGSSEDRVLSQSDLVSTFEWWLSGSTRLETHDTVMLDPVGSEKCAFHSRGDRRGFLEVICPDGHGQVRLEGDRTRFVQSTGLGENRMQEIVQTVANERLAGLNRHRNIENDQIKGTDK
jgi:phosphoglycerol transferase MdoB-like AlkP superfamily enzyme